MTDMLEKLSSRERQIMDIVFELRNASASQIRQRMPEPPGYSAVRTMLARMVAKGYLERGRKGNRHLYSPAETREQVRSSLLAKMLTTFFDGSVSQAVSGLLGLASHKVNEAELEELTRIIESAKRGES